MTTKVKVTTLKQQPDGVWSEQSAAEQQNVVAAELHAQLENIDDLSSWNNELFSLADNYERRMQICPLRANLYRPFDWTATARLLEIGCGGGAVTRFFAEQGVAVDAIETNRPLASLAALRTREFDSVRIISEEFSRLELDGGSYDAIILSGITDDAIALVGDSTLDYQTALAEFLRICCGLLSDQGQLFLAADNRQGIKYLSGMTDERTLHTFCGVTGYKSTQPRQTLNLFEWQQQLAHLGFAAIDEYYPFPDYRFSRVILGDEIVR